MQHLHLSLDDIPHAPQIGEGVLVLAERLREISMKRSGEYASHEHSLRLPLDANVLADVTHMAQRFFSTQLKYILVVGIGGSNLGAKAVYDALRGTLDGYDADTLPKILFADTVSPRLLLDLEHLFRTQVAYPEEIIINLVSKSGGTTESIANADILLATLRKHIPTIDSRVVVTTDHGSKLWQVAEKHGYGLLPIPKEVGGRFSVFSAVGLFPLLLAGVPVEELLLGARDVLTDSFGKENAPLRFATALYRSSVTEETSIINFFFFNPEFESLGKWSRQLYGESLGKEKDRSGKVIHAGITPIVSIGSTDLHSMAQLYFGGPRDKFTFFTYVPERTKLSVSSDGPLLPLVPALAGLSPDAVLSAIYEGVKAAYATHRLPRAELTLSAVSPYAVGQFLQFHMLAVMYLGELLHVNTFDQPNVEDYKNVTRTILERQTT